jgi:signal transduction histidine kinase
MSSLRLRIFMLCLGLALGLSALAQQKSPKEQVAALLQQAQQARQDSLKVLYWREALQLSEQQNYSEGILAAAQALAKQYRMKENLALAYQYYQKALPQARSLRKVYEEADLYYGLASIQSQWSNYKEALEAAYSAHRLYESLQEASGRAACDNMIGLIHNEMGEYEKSLQHFSQALQIYEQLADSANVAVAYNNLALSYGGLGKEDTSLAYLQKALQLSLKLRNYDGVGAAYNNMGDLYYYKKAYQEAIEYYQKSLKEYEKIDNLGGKGANFVSLGRVHKAQGDYENAVLFFGKAAVIFQGIGSKYQIAQIYKDIFEIYKLLNKPALALEFHELYTAFQDSLFNERISKQVKEVEARYEVAAQNKKIEQLEAAQKAKNNLNLALMVISTLALFTLVLLYYLYYNRQKSNRLLQEKNAKIQFQNEELLLSQKNLRELIQTRDKFFSIISHDLRSPLNSLTGFLQVLIRHSEAFSKEEIVQFATKLDKSVANLKDLLENLLTWSRAQTGGIEFHPEVLDIREIAEANIELLKNSASAKLLKLHLEAEGDTRAQADRNMVLFVLRNLLANAIKFTPKNGQISTQIIPKAHYIQISVSDTGIGMSQETLQKLFRIDVSHSQKGTDNEAGTGLGLILCKEFVEKNKGEIWVESQEGKGSTFHFTLPLANH